MTLYSPLPGGIANLRVNRTLHGRSVYRPRDVRGHNVIKAYSTPGKGDGLDLFVKHGTPVRAAHAGTITRIAESLGRLGCIYLYTGQTLTVYAHMHVRECLKVGAVISEGTLIGWVNGKIIKDPHLHLEVWLKGKAVSAPTAKKLQAKLAALFT